MNILVTITGLELKKEEEMVKLDMHILPPISKQENDWKAMVKEIKASEEKLEETAKNIIKILQGLHSTNGLVASRSNREDQKRT